MGGRGCHTAAEIATYLAANEVFGFNFYFINTLVNPDQQTPTSIFLDDTNNFPFSTTTGTSCNFFLEGYTISTDRALMPIPDMETELGGLAEVPALMTSYPASLGEYLRFYVRKSPVSLVYTRIFFRFDDLLSYIGGLFGLIALVIQLPMTYYNTCCFELSLATDLFVYKKKQKKIEDEKKLSLENPNIGNGSVELIGQDKHQGS